MYYELKKILHFVIFELGLLYVSMLRFCEMSTNSILFCIELVTGTSGAQRKYRFL